MVVIIKRGFLAIRATLERIIPAKNPHSNFYNQKKIKSGGVLYEYNQINSISYTSY